MTNANVRTSGTVSDTDGEEQSGMEGLNYDTRKDEHLQECDPVLPCGPAYSMCPAGVNPGVPEQNSEGILSRVSTEPAAPEIPR